MKKLLLASAVLAGMSASHVFASSSDVFTTDIDISIGETCNIKDTMTITASAGAVEKTDDVIHTISNLVGSTEPGMDEDFALTLTLSGQSYCNYPHHMEVISQYGGGFTSQDKISTTDGIDTAASSDDFKTVLPYKMDILGWGTQATTDVKWSQPTIDKIADFDAVAFTSKTDVDAVHGATGAKTLRVATTAPNLAFHNDGANASAGVVKNQGLAIKLTHTVPAMTEGTPMLSGLYTDRIYLRVAPSL